MKLTTICLNSGEKIEVDSSITILVGPSNVGKTRLLHEIHHYAEGPDRRGYVLEQANFDHLLHGQRMREWIDSTYPPAERHGGQWHLIPGSSGIGNISTPNPEKPLGHIANMFIQVIDCSSRLAQDFQTARPALDGVPYNNSGLNKSWMDGMIEDSAKLCRFQGYIKRAFDFNVILDAFGNSAVLRVSEDSTQRDFGHSTSTGLPDRAIADRLSRLARLQEQSDGVRSFASLALVLATASLPIILIDEPELFLHPPQARLLGRMLAEQAGNRQIIVATHSVDLILGIFEAGAASTSIHRLTRNSGKTRSSTLSAKDIADLWKDPGVRHSNALSGLFHAGVVLVEGTSDVSAYSYGLQKLETTASSRDILFIATGGKQNIPKFVKALSKLSIPTAVVVDFDVLGQSSELQRIVTSLNRVWTASMEALQRSLDAGLRGNVPAKPKAGPVRATLAELQDDDVLDKPVIYKITKLLKPKTKWQEAKESGISAVPKGEHTRATKDLLAQLAAIGIFVVPGGALESWAPAIGGPKDTWLGRAIEEGDLDEANDMHDFVRDVTQYLFEIRTTHALMDGGKPYVVTSPSAATQPMGS